MIEVNFKDLFTQQIKTDRYIEREKSDKERFKITGWNEGI